MFKWLFKKKEKKYEYLYFYVTGVDIFGDEETIALRKINLKVKEDIKTYNKSIQDRCVFENEKTRESLTLMGSQPLKFLHFQPLILEIYAYFKKSKDLSVFSYEFEQIEIEYSISHNTEDIFYNNNLNRQKTNYIFKFKVEC